MEFSFPVFNTSYGEIDCIGSVTVEADTLVEAESKAMVAAWEDFWDDDEIISIRIDSSAFRDSPVPLAGEAQGNDCSTCGQCGRKGREL